MSDPIQGRVVVSYGREVIVETGDGGLTACLMRRRGGERPVCGDVVSWRPTGDAGGVIERVEPRTTLIERGDFRGRPRPLAANVDVMIMVVAEPPGADTTLIDRYLALAGHVGLATVLLVNKADRLDETGRERLEHTLAFYREELAQPLVFASARDSDGLDDLSEHLQARTAIFVGHSGVGKSSLVNALVPELDLRIGALSATSGQGRHTTTATTLFHLPHGGHIIDSPGVRTLRLDHLPRSAVMRAFPEVERHRHACRFNDCRHNGEPGCAVAGALKRGEIPPERYHSLQTLLAEAS